MTRRSDPPWLEARFFFLFVVFWAVSPLLWTTQSWCCMSVSPVISSCFHAALSTVVICCGKKQRLQSLATNRWQPQQLFFLKTMSGRVPLGPDMDIRPRWSSLRRFFWRLYSPTAELSRTCQSVPRSGRYQHICICI